MAPKIYSTKDPLDLNRLRLLKPIIRNGSPFIKMTDIDNPIYILGPKCTVKNGFVKSGKKIFCDFVFGNEDTELLEWLENLEERSQKLIYENRNTWFETPLDEHDIENSMSSPYKPYKSGKCFFIRVNVPIALDKINIKVYDENENETDPENIKENTKVLAVLEFQGIRCSVRSFQFEIELKQLLIVEPEKIFETCIISKVNSKSSNQPIPETKPVPTETHTDPQTDTQTDTQIEIQTDVQQDAQKDAQQDAQKDAQQDDPLVSETEIQLGQDPLSDTLHQSETSTLSQDFSDSKNLEMNTETYLPEDVIEIVDIPFETNTDADIEKEPPLRLKNRNDVYYKLYKDLRQRAKEAKREALANYLEAKRIKNVYLLEDINDDSDEDLEEMNL